MDYYGPASQREQYFRNMGLNPDGTPLGSAPAPALAPAPPVDPVPPPMAGPSPYARRPQPQWARPGAGPMMGQGKNPFGGGGGGGGLAAGGYRQLMRPASPLPPPQQSFSSFSPMSGGMDAPQRPGPRRSASASSFSGSPFSGAPAPAPAPVPSFSSSDSMAVTPPQRQPLTRRGPTPW